MPEPKVRFKRDDGNSYPAWVSTRLSDLFQRINERNNGQFDNTKWISVAKMYYQNPDKVQSNNIDTRTYVMRYGDIAFEGHPNDEFMYGRFVLNDVGDGVISELFPIYRFRKEYVLKYWKYAIQVEKVMAPVYRKAITSSGASSNKLNEDDFLRESIYVPCLEEQQKIADFLSSVDEVISTSEQEVANLETQKKTVMKKIFSQEVRFKKADGTDFPEWEETTFGEIGAPYKNSIVDGPFGSNLKTQDYTESGVLVFQSNYITSGCFSIDKPFYISQKKAEDLKRCSAKSGDILIAKIGARFGMCDIIPPNIEGVLSSNSMKIDLDSRVALNVFYKFYLRYLYDTKYHYREIGITAQPALSLSYIRELEVPLPCLEEQRLIADFLSNFDEAIAAAKKELELWKELKKGLLQQMFV